MPNWVIAIVLIILCIAVAIIAAQRHIPLGRTGGAANRVKDLNKSPRTKSEQYVVSIFEKITGKPFPTVYPPWLTWRGKRMELDGYNAELKLGVEFSGPLHTKYYPARESAEKYAERVAKDKEKIRLCREHGVKLIVIDMSVPRRHLYNYIHSRLYDAGYTAEKPHNYMPEVVAVPWPVSVQ